MRIKSRLLIGALGSLAAFTALLHNEGFVSKYINGKPVYEMMIAELNPATTKLQLKVSTLQEGYDPVTYFEKYSGRFLSMRCQDWVKDPSTKVWLPPSLLGQGGRGLEGRLYSRKDRRREELLRRAGRGSGADAAERSLPEVTERLRRA